VLAASEGVHPSADQAYQQISQASQAVFAACLNVSLSTVQKWEIGGKKSNGFSLKLLNLGKAIEVLL